MPARNGKFTIQGNQDVYTYDYRDNVTTTELTTTLYGVRYANDPANNTPFSVTPTSGIIPNDFFTIVSTGTAGGASRTLTFITPVDVTAPGGVPGQETTYADSVTAGVNPGAETSNWFAASAGGYNSVADVAGAAKADGTTGTAALKLTSSLPYSGSSWWNDKYFSLMALKWSANYANFYDSWYNHANTLSYDAQVKTKLPQANNYYMAGMLFRLKMADSVANSSWLGVSFLRGQNGGNFFGTDRDGIEDGVVPLNNVPMIVLWKKDGGQEMSGMQWVAYKVIENINGFNNGSAPLFVNGTSYYIRGGTSGARAAVTVSTTDSGISGELANADGAQKYSMFQTNEELFQLIRQTPNSAIVTGDSATRIDFSYGQTGIAVGDIIVGRDSHASAKVTVVQSSGNWNKGNASGYVSIEQKQGNFNEGSWWVAGEELQIYRPNADGHSAHFAAISPLSDILTSGTQYIKDWSTLLLRLEEKSAVTNPFNGQYVNDIKIYVGDKDLHNTPTGSPLDILRYKNERWSNPPAADDVKWPPDAGWSSNLAENLSKDHFTLVTGWVVNPALSLSFSLTGTGEEPNSTIRTYTFTTHSLSTFTQQEIGLQTAGPAAMDNNTYFDDFAVQMEGGATGSQNGFTIPLQY